MKIPYIVAMSLASLSIAQATTIAVTGAVNSTDAADQGSASLGTLTATTLVADNSDGTGAGQAQQFTISDLDLNGSGGANDSIVVNFIVTSSNEILTSGSSAAGWLAGGTGNNMDTDGESLTITFSSVLVNLDGGTGNGAGSFLGFTGVTMGSWDYDELNGLPEDQATINGIQYASTADNETLTIPSSNAISLLYDTGSSDFGSWRHLGSSFSVEVVPEPSSSLMVGIAALGLMIRRKR